MCFSQGFTVKNTFICIVDTEDMSPVGAGRRRAVTDPHDILSSTATPSSAAGGSSSSSTDFLEDDATTAGEEASQRTLSSGSDRLSEMEASSLAALAFERRGSISMCRALEDGHGNVPSIVAALHGQVLEASRSSYGHQVLLTAIHYLRAADAVFIAEELRGHGREVALNSNGTLVISQLLAFNADDASTAALIDEIVRVNLPEIVCHKFGHRVARAVLEYGLHHQRQWVIRCLMDNLQRFARHRFASPVVEAAVLLAPEAEGLAVCEQLTSHPGAVVALACHGFGVRVTRALLQVDDVAEEALRCLCQGQTRLSKDKYGLQLLKSLGLDLPVAARATAGAATVAVPVACQA